MRESFKNKYLLRKLSGSKARYTYKPDYSDERNSKRRVGSELPFREKLKRRGYTYLDTSLVKRWLYSQDEKDFDIVYSEFLKRIQPKYRAAYKECIYYYVVKKTDVVIQDGLVMEKVSYNGKLQKVNPIYRPFYIDPETNKLKRVRS